MYLGFIQALSKGCSTTIGQFNGCMIFFYKASGFQQVEEQCFARMASFQRDEDSDHRRHRCECCECFHKIWEAVEDSQWYGAKISSQREGQQIDTTFGHRANRDLQQTCRSCKYNRKPARDRRLLISMAVAIPHANQGQVESA